MAENETLYSAEELNQLVLGTEVYVEPDTAAAVAEPEVEPVDFVIEGEETPENGGF